MEQTPGHQANHFSGFLFLPEGNYEQFLFFFSYAKSSFWRLFKPSFSCSFSYISLVIFLESYFPSSNCIHSICGGIHRLWARKTHFISSIYLSSIFPQGKILGNFDLYINTIGKFLSFKIQKKVKRWLDYRKDQLIYNRGLLE